MGTVRFLHTSDWQLGMTRHYLAGEAQARFTGDRVETIRRIGELAASTGAEFVVVAGDVFEHHNLGRQDVLRALEAMGSIQVPVYLLPGNHDPLGPGTLWESPDFVGRRQHNVILLDDVGPWPVREGVEIVAAPWRTKHPDSDPVAPALQGLPADGTVRIVVGHGMLAELQPDRAALETVHRGPLDAALAAGTVHYVALGDRHIQWPADGEPGHDHGAIHYSGAHETTGFREPDRGRVLEVVLADDLPTVTSHEVGRWLHHIVQADLDGAADIDALEARLAALEPKERIILKTRFAGTLSVSDASRLDALLDAQREVFAALDSWERHTDLAVVPDEAEFSALAAGGYVLESAHELAATAQAGGPDADTARDALKLLYRFTGGEAR
ncbi:DNA repair exonuclease SbcCD nuclease subunit [Raineyella antarctica]|uniref:DNA repair exonuclease SbcCD nuclease subunit n=1 Tax=Raineyella antarctica TaxID=1577474 RepID=A0A1G6GFR2_9ACTN|nr:metallophosphoesterase [Raineyella antarctica]SDB80016.1 DNA repair exonuclease SbcCD nuclease subunit [Raineyella antarctica]